MKNKWFKQFIKREFKFEDYLRLANIMCELEKAEGK